MKDRNILETSSIKSNQPWREKLMIIYYHALDICEVFEKFPMNSDLKFNQKHTKILVAEADFKEGNDQKT